MRIGLSGLSLAVLSSWGDRRPYRDSPETHFGVLVRSLWGTPSTRGKTVEPDAAQKAADALETLTNFLPGDSLHPSRLRPVRSPSAQTNVFVETSHAFP